jgi:hypothetical protein
MSRENRDGVLASYAAAERLSNESYFLVANPATMAGMLLKMAGGDAQKAIKSLPGDNKFFDIVRGELEAVAQEIRGGLRLVHSAPNVVPLTARK